MKIKQLPILLIIVCMAREVAGQLSAADLEAAVLGNTCEKIAAQLDTTTLSGEGMKFFGGICRYRNGAVEPALALFREVRQMGAQRQHFATYWEAKCLAALGQDSLAWACLQAIPDGEVHYRMLAQEEFARMAKENEAFTRLKQSLAPGFNTWTGLLAVVAVLGLLIGFLLLFGRSSFSVGEKRLSVAVFSAALILVSYLTIWTGYSAVFPYFQNIWQWLIYLIGPSLYLYLRETFQENFTAKEAAGHYLLPMVAGLCLLPGMLAPGRVTGLAGDFFNIGSSPVLMVAHLLLYSLLIRRMTANDWQVDTNIRVWTNMVAAGMMAYTGAFLSYFVLVRCSFFNPHWDYAISLVMSLGILAVAYMGLVQRRVFSSEPIGHFLPVKKYQSSSLTPSASQSIQRQMERLLREEQVFKENELRLADLAAYLDVSYHQLSQVINEHYGVNFFEFINQYRIDHVKTLLADPGCDHLTIIQIAYEAGFNNKVSFNRYFKKETGMTPSAYRIKVGEDGKGGMRVG